MEELMLAGVATALTAPTPHSIPARAAQYALVPCTSCAEVSCWVLENVTMKAPSAARITTKKIAAIAAKPWVKPR